MVNLFFSSKYLLSPPKIIIIYEMWRREMETKDLWTRLIIEVDSFLESTNG
jgi:hypothetical protein